MADSKSVRWDYIDLMEFLGILFVISYHSTTYSYPWMEEGSALFLFRYYLRTILSTCVPLFFFANGYLLLNRSFVLKKHIIKILKIIILTGIWGGITLLCLMPLKNEFLSAKEFFSYLWNFSRGWTNHLWYMGALVCIYIFFPLLKTAFDRSPQIFIYFTVICAILTFGNAFLNWFYYIVFPDAVKLQEGMVVKNWFNIFNPFRGIYGYSFVYFCLGGLAHKFVKPITEISVKTRNAAAISVTAFSCMALFITGIMLSNISGEMWDVVWNGYDTIFTLINVCTIFVLCLSYSGQNKMVKLISANTLGIYFMHIIVMNMTKQFVMTIPLARSFAGCLIYSLMLMFICLVLTQLLSRIPAVKKLVKL